MNDETNVPSAPLPERPWGQRLLDRRAVLRAAGVGGTAAVLAACSNESSLTSALLSPRRVIIGGVTLDFASDFGVLNYAYALEQLEAAFYTQVVSNAAFASIFAPNEQRVLTDLRDHEVIHREFLKAALGPMAIGDLTVDFSSVNFANRTNVLSTARAFEDLGVGAYNGAAKYIANSDYLTVAGKIVSVEARHASAIRDLLANRTGNFAPTTFDVAFSPSFVLSQADPYIVDSITAINT